MSFKITCSTALPLIAIVIPAFLFLCSIYYLFYIAVYGYDPFIIFWSVPFIVFGFILYAFSQYCVSFISKPKNKKRN